MSHRDWGAKEHLRRAIIEAVVKRIAWHRLPPEMAVEAAELAAGDLKAGRVTFLPPRPFPGEDKS